MRYQLSFDTIATWQFGRCSQSALTSPWATHSGDDDEIWTAENWDSSGTPALLRKIYIQFWSICHRGGRVRHARIENHLSVLKFYVAKKRRTVFPSVYPPGISLTAFADTFQQKSHIPAWQCMFSFHISLICLCIHAFPLAFISFHFLAFISF